MKLSRLACASTHQASIMESNALTSSAVVTQLIPRRRFNKEKVLSHSHHWTELCPPPPPPPTHFLWDFITSQSHYRLTASATLDLLQVTLYFG